MVVLTAAASQPVLLPNIRTDQLPPRVRIERIPGSKIRNHVACQTEKSEIPELRNLQLKIAKVTTELARVTAELEHMEQRLRYEMQDELEARLRLQGQKCADKITYMRQRAEQHMASVRASSQVRRTKEIEEQGRQLHGEIDKQTSRGEELEASNTKGVQEYSALHSLAVRYARENSALHQQLKYEK